MDHSTYRRARPNRPMSPSTNDTSLMTPASRGHALSFNTTADGSVQGDGLFLNSTLALSPIGPRVLLDTSLSPSTHIFSPIRSAAGKDVPGCIEQTAPFLALRQRIQECYTSHPNNALLLAKMITSQESCRLEDVVVLAQLYAQQQQYQLAIDTLKDVGFPQSTSQISIYVAQYWALRNAYGEHVISTDSPVSRFTNRLSLLTLQNVDKLPAGHTVDTGASFPFLHASPVDIVYIHSLLAKWYIQLKKPETAIRILGGNNLVHGQVSQIVVNYQHRLDEIDRLVRQKSTGVRQTEDTYPDTVHGGDIECVACIELGFEGDDKILVKQVRFSGDVALPMTYTAFQFYTRTQITTIDVSTVLSNIAYIRAEALEAQGNRERAIYYQCKSFFYNLTALDSIEKQTNFQLSDLILHTFVESCIDHARERQLRNVKQQKNASIQYLEVESHFHEFYLIQPAVNTLQQKVSKRKTVEIGVSSDIHQDMLSIEVFVEMLLRGGHYAAVETYLESSSLLQKSIKLSSMLASVYFLGKKDAKQHTLCTQMVKTFTSSHLTWLACSRYYLLIDNPVQAHQYITRAHTLAPTDVSVWLCLGHVSMDQKDVGKAIDAYRIASSIAPYDVQPLMYLASILGRNGRHAEAAVQFQKAVKLLGCSCDLLTSNFQCHCDIGNTDMLEENQENTKRHKNNAQSPSRKANNHSNNTAQYYELGIFQYETEEYASAAKWFERAITCATHSRVCNTVFDLLHIQNQTNMYHILATIEYAHTLRHLKQLEKAFRTYKEALEFPCNSRNTLTSIYSGLGMTLHQAGDIPNAVLMYNKVLGMEPNQIEIKSLQSKAVAQSTILVPDTGAL